MLKLRPRFNLRATVNGRPVEAEIEPRELLLDFLRDRLGLTGAKRSCDMQVCGACTVLVDGLPVSACCTLAYEAQGRQVLTIEGLAENGALHPLQEAFVQQSAVQCGFCTAGMILSAKHLLDEQPHPSREAIRHYLKGNLCRCTGYWNILEAIEAAAKRMDGEAQTP
jgi:carbon-monoxide dehydrogenase small subunit